MIVGVSISTRRERDNLDIPLHVSVVNEVPLQRGTVAKVERAIERRNNAMGEALDKFPDATDMLMIDSWYLRQGQQINRLIQDYKSLSQKEPCIVGASSWCAQPNSVSLNAYSVRNMARLFTKPIFYDTWVTPEVLALELPYFTTGIMRVNAVGACFIFPRWVWEKHPFSHNGLESENTCFCRESGLSCFLSFNARVWHPSYSLIKRLRVKLALGRSFRKGASTNHV